MLACIPTSIPIKVVGDSPLQSPPEQSLDLRLSPSTGERGRSHLLLVPEAMKKGIYDKFGEEGLKGGIPLEFGGENPWTVGYVFHNNPDKVFKEFFGGDNPFAGR